MNITPYRTILNIHFDSLGVPFNKALHDGTLNEHDEWNPLPDVETVELMEFAKKQENVLTKLAIVYDMISLAPDRGLFNAALKVYEEYKHEPVFDHYSRYFEALRKEKNQYFNHIEDNYFANIEEAVA
jgi:hypothetical protein